MFKLGLQYLADESDIVSLTTLYTPCWSNWNPIEPKLFSFVSKNWRAILLDSINIANNLILNTKSKTISTINTNFDPKFYNTNVNVDQAEYNDLNICG